MKTYYCLDSTRISFREYWSLHRSPLILLAWLWRLVRFRVPMAMDEPPNVEALAPFEVNEAELPQEVNERFRPFVEELQSLGFQSPIFHAISIDFYATKIYRATLCHSSGCACARIHYRIWTQPRFPKIALYPVFLTGFKDGRYLVSSAGKRDLRAPPDCQVHYHPGATPKELWDEHQLRLQEMGDQSILQAKTPPELRTLIESHHALLRDFHIARGVFVPFSDAELAAIRGPSAAAPTEELPVEHADVLAEVYRIQNRKSSWLAGVLTLAVSLLVFAGAARTGWSWNYLVLLNLIPILFFHELGHLAAMRLFHYRNTRMLFIPFLGAAVTGQNHNVAGWKKALVALAGPLPGIGAGIMIGIIGLIAGRSWLVELALLALILNGFNLLPLLPLDGGRVLHATLFCRHRYLELVFRSLAVFGLLGLALLVHDRILAFVGIAFALTLPTAYRTARIADRMRARGPALPGADEQLIPNALANQIIAEVKNAFPRALGSRTKAQLTLNVFETLNARPPGWLATSGLLGLQGMSLALALLFAVLLALGQRGNLLGTLRMAAERPKTPYGRGSTRVWPVDQPPPSGSRCAIVANFSHRAQAEATFDGLSGRLPAKARLTLFGQTLFLSLPTDDEKERNLFFDELERQTKQIAVHQPGHSIGCSLFCIAPDDEAAQRIEEELRGYFAALLSAEVIPPWSPAWQQSPNAESWRKARRTYYRLTRDPATFLMPPELTQANQKLNQELRRAMARGNKSEQSRLMAELRRLGTEAELSRFASLRSEGPDQVDLQIVDLYSKWRKSCRRDRQEEEPKDLPKLPGELIERLGLLPGTRATEDRKGQLAGDVWGNVSRGGLYLSIFFSPGQLDLDLPALAEWLYANNCINVTYQCDLEQVQDLEGDEVDQAP